MEFAVAGGYVFYTHNRLARHNNRFLIGGLANETCFLLYRRVARNRGLFFERLARLLFGVASSTR